MPNNLLHLRQSTFPQLEGVIMSQETTREVYNNGHRRVVVELFPEETECREVKYIVGEHCTRIE